jgi:hypothetical protein
MAAFVAMVFFSESELQIPDGMVCDGHILPVDESIRPWDVNFSFDGLAHFWCTCMSWSFFVYMYMRDSPIGPRVQSHSECQHGVSGAMSQT